MDKELFVESLMRSIKNTLGENVTVQQIEVLKNNDMQLNGLCLKRKDDVIGVNIYLDGYYERYLCGEEMESIIMDIKRLFEADRPFGQCDLELIKNIDDFNAIKEKLAVKLISKKRNVGYLQGKYYLDYLDFAICFLLQVNENDGYNASVVLPEAVVSKWEITKQEMLIQALSNMKKKHEPRILSMLDVLKRMVADMSFDEKMDLDDYPMYVLENGGINGATGILYDGLLYEFANKLNVEKLVILPSSIHECILIPYKDDINLDSLCGMVKEVNATNVSPEDVLSDHIYIYDTKKNEIVGYEGGK